MSQDFSILVSKTDGELVECSPKSLSLFPSSSKDLGPGLDPLTMKLVPCLNSVVKDYALNLQSGSLFIIFIRF